MIGAIVSDEDGERYIVVGHDRRTGGVKVRDSEGKRKVLLPSEINFVSAIDEDGEFALQ